MAKTVLKTRLTLKHDIPANWEIAGKAEHPFIPLQGELIIYDDRRSSSEGGDIVMYPSSRYKIGDGETNVNDLPFIDLTEADIKDIVNNMQLSGYVPINNTEELSIKGEDKISIATSNGDIIITANTNQAGSGAIEITQADGSSIIDLAADRVNLPKDAYIGEKAIAIKEDIPTKLSELDDDIGCSDTTYEIRVEEAPLTFSLLNSADAESNQLNIKLNAPDALDKNTADTLYEAKGVAADLIDDFITRTTTGTNDNEVTIHAEAIKDANGYYLATTNDLNEIETNATTAYNTANTANSTANLALEKANNALDSAAEVYSLAEGASNDAATANVKAGNALTKAENAETVATTANNKIDALQITATENDTNLTLDFAAKYIQFSEEAEVRIGDDLIATRENIPTKLSQLDNDTKFITSAANTEYSFAATSNPLEFEVQGSDDIDNKTTVKLIKPTYTASEVGAAAATHNHDDRYYTDDEIDAKLNTYATKNEIPLTLADLGYDPDYMTVSQDEKNTWNNAASSIAEIRALADEAKDASDAAKNASDEAVAKVNNLPLSLEDANDSGENTLIVAAEDIKIRLNNNTRVVATTDITDSIKSIANEAKSIANQASAQAAAASNAIGTGVLTINQGGVKLGEFSANDNKNVEINIIGASGGDSIVSAQDYILMSKLLGMYADSEKLTQSRSLNVTWNSPQSVALEIPYNGIISTISIQWYAGLDGEGEEYWVSLENTNAKYSIDYITKCIRLNHLKSSDVGYDEDKYNISNNAQLRISYKTYLG